MCDGVVATKGQPDARVSLADGEVSLSHMAAGCWRLVEQSRGALAAVDGFIDTALALGITTFDHADIYGRFEAEALFGRALAARPGLRRGIELVSKCGIAPVLAQRPEHRVLHIDSSRGYITRSVERSLRALATEHLDVLLLHRPDPLMEVDEVASALTELRAAGKVRAVGVSNFNVGQFALLQSRLAFPLVTNQVEVSIVRTGALRDGTLDDLQRRGLPAMTWSPLAGGRLMVGQEPRETAVRRVLCDLAGQYGVAPSTVAIAWVMRLPGSVIPVLGSSDRERLRDVARAAAIRLDRQDWFALYAAAGNTFA